MGYTHYWTPNKMSEEQWSLLTAAARAIIADSGVDIAGWDGQGDPQIDEEVISLNGRGPVEDHETFRLTRSGDPAQFGFCKTAHKPYDVVVTTILAARQTIASVAPARFNIRHGGFRWGSDGGNAAITAATDNYRRLVEVRGYGDRQDVACQDVADVEQADVARVGESR